jgi:hypothetical protein
MVPTTERRARMSVTRHTRRNGSAELHSVHSVPSGHIVTDEQERIIAAKLRLRADQIRKRQTPSWIVELAQKDAD